MALSPVLKREDGELAVRRLEGETGEGGGGMSVLRVERGVPLLVVEILPNPNDCRDFEDPGAGIPIDVREAPGAFGVANGDVTERVGLADLWLFVLPFFTFCNCCAVIPMYLLARDPVVKLGSGGTADFCGFANGVGAEAPGVTAE
jgi:hypothetical protein